MTGVGDRVKLLADIYDDGCENHHPPGYFAHRGEVLVIRNIRVLDDNSVLIYISHEHITDKSFWVYRHEIEPVTETTNAKP